MKCSTIGSIVTIIRVAVLWDALSADQFRAAEGVARVVGVQFQSLELRDPPAYDYNSAFTAAAREGAEALLVLRSPLCARGLIAGRQGAAARVVETFACVRRLRTVTVSLSARAEKLGIRPGAVTMMQQQMGALQQVYELLRERERVSESRKSRGCSSTAPVRWEQAARSLAAPVRDQYPHGVELHGRDL